MVLCQFLIASTCLKNPVNVLMIPLQWGIWRFFFILLVTNVILFSCRFTKSFHMYANMTNISDILGISNEMLISEVTNAIMPLNCYGNVILTTQNILKSLDETQIQKVVNNIVTRVSRFYQKKSDRISDMFLICLSLINNFSQITNGSEECSIKVSDVLDVSNYNAKDIYLIDQLLCLNNRDELLTLLSNVSIILYL